MFGVIHPAGSRLAKTWSLVARAAASPRHFQSRGSARGRPSASSRGGSPSSPAERGPEDVGAGGSWIKVFLQSCVAAERSVAIQPEDVAGLLERRGSVTTPRLEPVILGPGEVGALQVPVRPGPKPAKRTWLYVSLRARGEPGRRLRRHRGRPPSERTRQGSQLFALLGGYVVWGGGVRFAFVNPGERSGSDEAPAPTWHSMVRAMGSP